MAKYTIYKLDFHGTDKVYIGCTMDLGKRFANHKKDDHWLDLCLMPKSIDALRETSDYKEAADLEAKYIKITWDYNLNEYIGGYIDWIKIREKKEEEEFIRYQNNINLIEDISNSKPGGKKF